MRAVCCFVSSPSRAPRPRLWPVHVLARCPACPLCAQSNCCAAHADTHARPGAHPCRLLPPALPAPPRPTPPPHLQRREEGARGQLVHSARVALPEAHVLVKHLGAGEGHRAHMERGGMGGSSGMHGMWGTGISGRCGGRVLVQCSREGWQLAAEGRAAEVLQYCRGTMVKLSWHCSGTTLILPWYCCTPAPWGTWRRRARRGGSRQRPRASRAPAQRTAGAGAGGGRQQRVGRLLAWHQKGAGGIGISSALQLKLRARPPAQRRAQRKAVRLVAES